MRVKYTIIIDTNSTPSEVAATHFMTEVFKLAEESNLTGKELNIIRQELPDNDIDNAVTEMQKQFNELRQKYSIEEAQEKIKMCPGYEKVIKWMEK